MKKVSGQALRYRNGQYPENLDEILSNADVNDLKVLIALQMAADGDGGIEEIPDLSSLLGLEEAEVNASLKLWRVAGLVGGARKAVTASKPKKNEKKTAAKTADTHTTEESQKTVSAPESAHRNGALTTSGVQSYTTAELAELLERRAGLAVFVSEAQRVLGRVFNHHDTGIVIGLVEQYGFDEEAVLHILSYAYRLRGAKATPRYAEKIALTLYDEGILEAEEVIVRIQAIERAGEVVSQIRSLFGIGTRALSSTEKKLFSKWVETYGFELDAIRMAYDITVDAIHTPAPKYADKILERWHTEGLRTARDIEEFERERKSESGKSDVAKSYDVDDFFEASLKRSYEALEADLKDPE